MSVNNSNNNYDNLFSAIKTDKTVRILDNSYRDTMYTFSTVRINGELSDWFETGIGVLQW